MKAFFIAIVAITMLQLKLYAQVNVGLKAGLNLANTKNIGTGSNARLGFNAGLLAEFVINKKFIFQPEALYSVKGNKFQATELSSGGTLSLNYISVPLLAGYRPSENTTIFLGPELNFLTAAKSKFGQDEFDLSKIYRKFDMGIDAGIAYNLSQQIGIEARYYYGFDDLVDGVITDDSGNEVKKDRFGSNQVLQLGIVYKFPH